MRNKCGNTVPNSSNANTALSSQMISGVPWMNGYVAAGEVAVPRHGFPTGVGRRAQQPVFRRLRPRARHVWKTAERSVVLGNSRCRCCWWRRPRYRRDTGWTGEDPAPVTVIHWLVVVMLAYIRRGQTDRSVRPTSTNGVAQSCWTLRVSQGHHRLS